MNRILIISTTVMTVYLLSCNKFIDKKPDIKLSIPTTLSDFERLLNDPYITDFSAPGIADLGADDYYLRFNDYQSLLPDRKNSYIWASDIWEGAPANDWNVPYSIIYICNVVLDGLETFEPKNNSDLEFRDVLYGWALFVRAFEYYWLEETFGQPYRPASAHTDLGVPLKLSTSLEDRPRRATAKEVYDRIVSDLKNASQLVPKTTSTTNKPSKAAVYALLARVYLTMQDYTNALTYADSCLQIKSQLFDYNNLTVSQINSLNPFSAFSPPNDLDFEVLYSTYQIQYNVLRRNIAHIDSTLLHSYDSNDLRKQVFFRFNESTKTSYFKGFYSGSNARTFTGPAIDEVYLVRAEAYARQGNIDLAMNDLNHLLSKRYKSGEFVPLEAEDQDAALAKILEERRKELLIRGLRWIDLRRLNQDPRFKQTLKRELEGHVHTLLPNDPKYAYPIPENEILLNGLIQNPR